MGDGVASPRCVRANEAFKHAHADFLPLPEDVPEPRLFVVYGDGEAEELLLTRNAVELLRLSKQDPECVVVEGEQLGPPMDTCTAHTIFRAASSDAVSVPANPAVVPTAVAGFRSDKDAFAPAPGRSFTEFRQFTEYPAISEDQLVRFRQALAEHIDKEEKHRAQQAAYGQGLNVKKREMAVPDVGGG